MKGTTKRLERQPWCYSYEEPCVNLLMWNTSGYFVLNPLPANVTHPRFNCCDRDSLALYLMGPISFANC